MLPIDIPVELVVNIVVAGIFFLFWILVFIFLYHLSRFGIGTQPKRFAAIFFIGTIILFSLNLILYTSVDLGNVISLIP